MKNESVSKFVKWLNEKKGDIFLSVVVIPLAASVCILIGNSIIQPGLVRDIGFYFLCAVAILSIGLGLPRWISTSQRGWVYAVGFRVSNALATIATQEAEQFQQSVVILDADVDGGSLKSDNPSLLFTFHLFNGSVFPIRVMKVDGHVRFNGEELFHVPEYTGDSMFVEHGRSHRFSLRQWILPDVARRIADRMATQGCRCDFVFDSVSVTIATRPEYKTIDRPFSLPTVTNFGGPWKVMR